MIAIILLMVSIAAFIGVRVLPKYLQQVPIWFLIVSGILLVLAAVPVGYFVEIAANGCCGAPSTGLEGIGYVLMGAMGLMGFALLIFAAFVPSLRRKSK